MQYILHSYYAQILYSLLSLLEVIQLCNCFIVQRCGHPSVTLTDPAVEYPCGAVHLDVGWLVHLEKKTKNSEV